MFAPTHRTYEIVLGTTLWLIRRYRKTGCKKIARLIDRHLRWLRTTAMPPAITQTYQRLTFEWLGLSGCAVNTARNPISSLPACHP